MKRATQSVRHAILDDYDQYGEPNGEVIMVITRRKNTRRNRRLMWLHYHHRAVDDYLQSSNFMNRANRSDVSIRNYVGLFLSLCIPMTHWRTEIRKISNVSGFTIRSLHKGIFRMLRELDSLEKGGNE